MAVLRRWRNDYPFNEVIYLSPQTPLPSTVAPLLSLFPFFFSFSFRYPHSPKRLAISPNKHPIKGHIVSFLSSSLPLPPKQLNYVIRCNVKTPGVFPHAMGHVRLLKAPARHSLFSCLLFLSCIFFSLLLLLPFLFLAPLPCSHPVCLSVCQPASLMSPSNMNFHCRLLPQ